jgi:hypothetical protein
LLSDPLTTPINTSHLLLSSPRARGLHTHRSLARASTPSHFPPCSRSSGLRSLDSNIWHPPWFKPEDIPDYATKTTEPTPSSKRKFTPNLRPKPINPPPTHPNPTHHRRRIRKFNLQRYSRTLATPTSHVVHYSSGL